MEKRNVMSERDLRIAQEEDRAIKKASAAMKAERIRKDRHYAERHVDR